MDKYEYTVKTEKIKKLVEKKDYVAAAKVADTIDWSRVQDVKFLVRIAEVYERNRRYADAKDVLLCAYEQVPVGRRMLYRLTELSIKEGNMEEAVDFFEEFRRVAPSDAGQYILCYQMAVAQGEPIEKQIALLEGYRKKEFEEKWAYELARLYSKAGDADACVRLCDEIFLWFGSGKYVEKAMELKQNYEALTPNQIEKLQHSREQEARMEAVSREYETKVSRAKETAARETAATVVTWDEAQEEIRKAKKAERAKKTQEPERRKKMMGRSQKTRRQELEERVHRVERVPEVEDEPIIPEEEREWSEPRYMPQEVPAAQSDTSKTRQWEELLAAAVLTADQFDEDGFALDLSAPKALEEEPAAELQSAWPEVDMAAAAEILPQIDLECVREAVAEEDVSWSAKALEPVVHTEEELGWDAPLGSGTQMNLEDVLREMGMDSVESGESSLVAELQRMPEVLVETSQTEALSEVTLEEEVSQLSAKLMESLQDMEVAGQVDDAAEVPAKEFAQEPAEEPEVPEEPVQDEVVQEIAVEELVEEALTPVFACVLMEAPDAATTLSRAVEQIKKTHANLGTQALQAAKISGAKLNKKGVRASLERLNGRDLIVEGAGALERSLLLELVEVLKGQTAEGVIVLTDEAENLHKLINLCPEIVDVTEYIEAEAKVDAQAQAAEEAARAQKELEAKKKAEEELRLLMEERAKAEAERREAEAVKRAEEALKAQLEEAHPVLPEVEAEETEAADGSMTVKEFVKCVEDYAYEMECVLDEKAGLAVHEIAEQMLEDGEELTEENAHELADDAIYLAERPSLRGLFSGKYNKEGYLILKERHFTD